MRDHVSDLKHSQLSVTEGAHSLYESWQGDYDRQLLQACSYRSPQRAAQLLTSLLPSLGVTASFNQPWLDLGAGTGLVGQALVEAGVKLPLVAVDISRAMLTRIDGDPYVACAVADVLDAAALASFSAQGAIALGLSEHVLDLKLLLATCASAIPRGAPLVFSYCPITDDSDRENEVFESFSGLIAHGTTHVTRALETNDFALLEQHDGPGYCTGGRNVLHRIVIARRR